MSREANDGKINGMADPSVTVVPNFRPTVHDLEVLVKHYFNEDRDLELLMYEHGQWCQSWQDSLVLAGKRLKAIAAVLGVDRVNEIIEPLAKKWNERYFEARRRKAEKELQIKPCTVCGAPVEPGEPTDTPKDMCEDCILRNGKPPKFIQVDSSEVPILPPDDEDMDDEDEPFARER